MTMLTSAMDSIGIGEAGVIALLGYGVVFLGIIFLMVVVIIIGAIFSRKDNKVVAAPAAEPAAAPVVEAETAPGTAGQLMLHDVEPKTAAMIMAIVADKMGKPLNELRFISIKEVK